MQTKDRRGQINGGVELESLVAGRAARKKKDAEGRFNLYGGAHGAEQIVRKSAGTAQDGMVIETL